MNCERCGKPLQYFGPSSKLECPVHGTAVVVTGFNIIADNLTYNMEERRMTLVVEKLQSVLHSIADWLPVHSEEVRTKLKNLIDSLEKFDEPEVVELTDAEKIAQLVAENEALKAAQPSIPDTTTVL